MESEPPGPGRAQDWRYLATWFMAGFQDVTRGYSPLEMASVRQHFGDDAANAYGDGCKAGSVMRHGSTTTEQELRVWVDGMTPREQRAMSRLPNRLIDKSPFSVELLKARERARQIVASHPPSNRNRR